MSYKHFAIGPWAHLNGLMTWSRLKLLMDYPEQHALYFPAGTPPVETDVSLYLLISLLGGITPWWQVLQFDDRRTKDYKTAAEAAHGAGLVPVLHHEFTLICDLAAMVVNRHPDLKQVKLALYTKKVDDQEFGGLHLVDGAQRVIIPKLEQFSGIRARGQASDWLMQAHIARWVTGTTQAAVLVVDDTPPGRSVMVPMQTYPPGDVQQLVRGYLGATYKSSAQIPYEQFTAQAQGEWPRRWVVDQVAHRNAAFKVAGATVLPVGEYKGQTLDEIASTDKGLHYLEWLSDQTGANDERPFVQVLRTYLSDPTIRKAAGHRG